jgi:hypothetical protein
VDSGCRGHDMGTDGRSLVRCRALQDSSAFTLVIMATCVGARGAAGRAQPLVAPSTAAARGVCGASTAAVRGVGVVGRGRIAVRTRGRRLVAGPRAALATQSQTTATSASSKEFAFDEDKEVLDMDMGLCTVAIKYTPELIRSKVLSSPLSTLKLLARGWEVTSQLGVYAAGLALDQAFETDGPERVKLRASQLRCVALPDVSHATLSLPSGLGHFTRCDRMHEKGCFEQVGTRCVMYERLLPARCTRYRPDGVDRIAATGELRRPWFLLSVGSVFLRGPQHGGCQRRRCMAHRVREEHRWLSSSRERLKRVKCVTCVGVCVPGREMLSRLGPSFIKAGQVLANRPDVLRADYMTELCILQDNVPAFPNQQAFDIMEVKAPSSAAVMCCADDSASVPPWTSTRQTGWTSTCSACCDAVAGRTAVLQACSAVIACHYAACLAALSAPVGDGSWLV